MKTVLPTVTRSLYRKIIPPPQLYLLGDSSRRKVLRAVQANYLRPHATPETDQFIPVFNHLAYGVQDRWEVQQQYSSCRWLYNFQDDNLAASHLLHYGWIGKLDVPMGGSSQHKISIMDDGVLIDIEYSHTFQERLEAACDAADLAIEDAIRTKRPRLLPELISPALQAFFYYKKRYISINADYRMNITNKLTAYIEHAINPLRDGQLIRPSVDEPDDILEDQVFLLKWEDFEIGEKVSSAQISQRVDNNAQKTFDAMYPKTLHLPRGVVLTRAQLLDCIHKDVITTSVKAGFLIKGERGKYIIPEDIDERS